MKRAIAVLLAILLFTSGLLVSCTGRLVGSGNLKTETYNFGDFTRVNVSNAFAVEIVQSSSYSIKVTVDDNILKYVDVSQQGETLQIGLKTVVLLGPKTLKAEVTMPRLSSLEFSGATRGNVSGFSSTENLDIDLSGASTIELINISAGDISSYVSGASKVTGDITSKNAEFVVSGASSVQLEGSADDMLIKAAGASRVQLAGFTADNVDIDLSGASTGTVNLDGRLDANLSGASKLWYTGEPTMGTINTSGASSLSKK